MFAEKDSAIQKAAQATNEGRQTAVAMREAAAKTLGEKSVPGSGPATEPAPKRRSSMFDGIMSTLADKTAAIQKVEAMKLAMEERRLTQQKEGKKERARGAEGPAGSGASETRAGGGETQATGY